MVYHSYSSALVGWRSLELAGWRPLSPSFCILYCWNSNLDGEMEKRDWRRTIRQWLVCVAEFVGLPFQSFTVPIQSPSDKSFIIHGNSQELQPLPDQTRTNHWNNKLSQPVSICSCLREVQTSFQGNPPLIPMEDFPPNQGETAEHASETNSQLKDVTWKLKNIN